MDESGRDSYDENYRKKSCASLQKIEISLRHVTFIVSLRPTSLAMVIFCTDWTSVLEYILTHISNSVTKFLRKSVSTSVSHRWSKPTLILVCLTGSVMLGGSHLDVHWDLLVSLKNKEETNTWNKVASNKWKVMIKINSRPPNAESVLIISHVRWFPSSTVCLLRTMNLLRCPGG